MEEVFLFILIDLKCFKYLFFFRYDYENCASEGANNMMTNLEKHITSPSFKETKLTNGDKAYVVQNADNYSYKDPIDGSVAEKQVRYTTRINHGCF